MPDEPIAGDGVTPDPLRAVEDEPRIPPQGLANAVPDTAERTRAVRQAKLRRDRATPAFLQPVAPAARRAADAVVNSMAGAGT
jgi:hypothetical protein